MALDMNFTSMKITSAEVLDARFMHADARVATIVDARVIVATDARMVRAADAMVVVTFR
jgi:hypothetical protein